MAGRMSERDRHGPPPTSCTSLAPGCLVPGLCLPLPHARSLHPVVRVDCEPSSAPGLQTRLAGVGAAWGPWQGGMGCWGTPLPGWPSLLTPVVLPFSTLIRGESSGLRDAERLACGRQRVLGPLARSPREGAGSCPGWTISQVPGPVRHGTRGRTWCARQATQAFSWPTDHLQPAGARRPEHG